MRTSVVLLFMGGLLLAAGTFTRSWLTATEDSRSMHVGLRDAEMCSPDDCSSFSFLNLMKESSRGRDVLTAVAGLAAFGLGILAMLFAAITGGLVISNAPKSALGVLTLIAVALAGMASFAFIASLQKGGALSFGYSLFAFEAGFVCTLIGAIMSLSHAPATGTFGRQ